MDKSIPFFTTDASLGKSILTSDDPEVFDKKQNKTIFKEINDSSPISIWSIANIYEINPVYVVEDSFVSFVSHYKYAKKLKKQLIFGCKFKIVTDSNDTTEESLKTESNVVVWMKNNKGYEDLIKLYSAIHSDQNKYYWDRFNMIGYNRGDWKMLQKYLTNNLLLTIPFYHSFLHHNLLKYGSRAVPEFGKIKPVFTIESHDLPFDGILSEAVKNYCQSYDYQIINTHSIYYYAEKDLKAYQLFRAINKRTNFQMPEMPYFSQPTFSFETWKKNNE